jgi:beta-aspartyl-peptidase (threonine type)
MTEFWSSAGGRWGILVHGGAGKVPLEQIPERESGCREAAESAALVLGGGGTALDAAQRAVERLEANPLFNAGTGAALTADGKLEFDASMMEGAGLRAGAVCALPPYFHPVAVARAVLEEGLHVLYAAQGADAFARGTGFTPADPAQMVTVAARANLEKVLSEGTPRTWAGGGTVGAVARDAEGHLAAATSTGGITGKRPGRVGDTGLIGAGTYADDRGGAASATGQGEGIIRVHLCGEAVAHLVTGRAPDDIARQLLERMRDRVGATGGIILVRKDGVMGLSRTTTAMCWAAAWEGADVVVGH